jgi:hypothetical protein
VGDIGRHIAKMVIMEMEFGMEFGMAFHIPEAETTWNTLRNHWVI